MKVKTFYSNGPGLSDLEQQIDSFLQSGIRVASPPQLIQDARSSIWHGAIFYEQPSSPGINDHDRAQRSLTSEDVKKSERITERYLQKGGVSLND